jgi:methylated-DNA-[protein]-cysteine S-methyltransferase
MPEISLDSPVGTLTVREANGAVVAIDWRRGTSDGATPLLREARAQLEAYFAGRLQRFNLPLVLAGSRFQQAVWQAMLAIPSGAVRTYGEVAVELCASPRAVGGACGKNPIPIIVPCHRIVAANGALGGYSGADGAETKRFLLALEGRSAPQLGLFRTKGENDARHNDPGEGRRQL